jgi:hypothetical protein
LWFTLPWTVIDEPPKPATPPPEESRISLEIPNVDSAYPRYKYSVVPGGIHSLAELTAVVARDPVVRAHYGDIDFDAVRFIRLESSRAAYVSYRVGDAILWTRRRIQLPRGELVLSDGAHLIRARCGNRISERPQEPVEEQAERAGFDDPEPPAIFAPMTTRPQITWEVLPLAKPEVLVPALASPPSSEMPPLLHPVPEPRTAALFVSGLGAIGVATIMRRGLSRGVPTPRSGR